MRLKAELQKDKVQSYMVTRKQINLITDGMKNGYKER